MKYLKYYITTVILLLSFIICSQGSYYPTLFFISFSLLIIMGDIFLPEETMLGKYKYSSLLNFPIYLNFPLLYSYLFTIIFIFSNYNTEWVINIYNDYLFLDIVSIKNSITILDKISLLILTGLFIGIMGTVPGHELTHRKRNKFDMFVGNWLLAISWDCAFAIEHVYGHHKNVGLSSDPATAKRGENIYAFIIKASIKEQKDAWLLEFNHLKRRKYNPFGIHNKMIIGYIRSIIITMTAYIVGGTSGLLYFLLFAFIAKSLLEVINYIEHYGLVRVPGKPVEPRHSWNCNNIMSSIFLCNVTRHSAHHERSNLKFWELEPYKSAPMLPYGYLTMLYLAIIFPYIFHSIMNKKLNHWDENFAIEQEKKILELQNYTI